MLSPEPPCRDLGYDRLADPVKPRGPDRTKPPLGHLELLHQASVPIIRQVNVLVHADDEFVRDPLEGGIQASGRAWTVLDRYDFVVEARVEARRSEQIALKQLVIRNTRHER
jgi:hypothetical protein